MTRVLGIVGYNGAGEVCFFPTSLADGLPLLSADDEVVVKPSSLRSWLKSSPCRDVPAEILNALNGDRDGLTGDRT